MNTKHTPGPWSFDRWDENGTTRFYVSRSEGAPQDQHYNDVATIIADTCGGDLVAIQEANARLIAAAPELLEALQLVEFIYGEQLDEKMLTCHAKFPTAGMYVRAALAKATGGGE
jgi:hypothetical protein